jgi:hypothetical protein
MKYLVFICLLLIFAEAKKPQPWTLNFGAWIGSMVYSFLEAFVFSAWYVWIGPLMAMFG